MIYVFVFIGCVAYDCRFEFSCPKEELEIEKVGTMYVLSTKGTGAYMDRQLARHWVR